ncbi:uncharacterized protein LOC121416651 [Lytechinus variegatus]|uniref:uncharacterized protein LOC121416651 n=1 Tax=Lytechinus variegatus TaxID=7654 RepID=UPI001BB2726E|nr:uncharacterized protein LOC121416651 [Lytechinus variegatus]XP_041466075.1 uncharacterized protein LOC121416651 [Lytechinus variegatus]XP_041466079.1 uncharacterized protein LOC121416651 [Lytechinus variegatus]
MDLDAALNELGMLSIVTESRKEYLKERVSQNENNMNNAASSSQAPSFHIVKMNTQFVTCVGSVLAKHGRPVVTSSSSSAENGVVEAEKSTSASRPYPSFLVNEHRVVRTHRPPRRCQKKPYALPHSHRSKASSSRKGRPYLSTSFEDDVFLEDPQVDCNGNGQKHRRPSSEVASKGSLTVPEIHLHRSKSLDDIHLERLRIDDGLSRHRSDVELASKLISNLKVS